MQNYMENLRIAYLSLGCKVNAYETASMRNQLEACGSRTVGFRETADVYLVNTCTVTNIADRKSRQMLHQAKKRNPAAVVVAVGCYVQEFYKNHETDETIDLLIGNRRKHEVAEILQAYLEARANGRDFPRLHVSDDSALRTYEAMEPAAADAKTRAYIKIQDGCNQFCSYCMIPFARGRISSRDAEDIRSEITLLAEKGIREFVLTGIHLSSYGMDDASPREQQALCREDGRQPLLELILSLAALPGVERLRLGSLEPRIVTEPFVKGLAAEPKVCPHFHLSLQSGCDEILRAMNRKYTTAQYLKCCRLLRAYYDQPAITTDLIVGFPGETEEQFEASAAFAKACGFAQMHVFPFSRRRGTAADRMGGQVSEEEKRRRERRMLAVAAELSDAYRRERIGRRTELLTEETVTVEGRTYWVGHSLEYLPTAVSATAETAGNQRITVEITGENVGEYVLGRPTNAIAISKEMR